jgi:hypothetical protein
VLFYTFIMRQNGNSWIGIKELIPKIFNGFDLKATFFFTNSPILPYWIVWEESNLGLNFG